MTVSILLVLHGEVDDLQTVVPELEAQKEVGEVDLEHEVSCSRPEDLKFGVLKFGVLKQLIAKSKNVFTSQLQSQQQLI